MKRLLGIAGSLLLAVAVVLLLVWVGQRRLIYFPPVDQPPPAGAVLPGAEEIVIETPDGLELGGWFLDGGDPEAATVLVFNGNAGHRGHRAPLASALAHHGLSVLLLDYRGYGGNPGSPSERGLLEDARGARAWLERAGRAGPVVYFGESLGTGVAVSLAAEHEPDLLILRSPFTSMVDVARRHYPFLPVGLLLTERFLSIERIGELECPLLVILGTADRIVPEDLSRQLYDAARMELKRLVVIEGAGHNDAEMLYGDTLIREVVGLVESLDRSTREPRAPARPDPEDG